MRYFKDMSFHCQRCGQKEEGIDHPENVHDFHYKYGFLFCESCMEYWIKADLKSCPDKREGLI